MQPPFDDFTPLSSQKLVVGHEGCLSVCPVKERHRIEASLCRASAGECVCTITPVLLRITQLDLFAKGLWLLQRSVPQPWIITELAECSALRRSQMSTTSVQTGIKKKKLPQMWDCSRGKGRPGQMGIITPTALQKDKRQTGWQPPSARAPTRHWSVRLCDGDNQSTGFN